MGPVRLFRTNSTLTQGHAAARVASSCRTTGPGGVPMRRRDFITLLGGAVAWPVAARAEQTVPVIGILYNQSPDGFESRPRAFPQGLKEVPFVEGENVT